MIFRKLLLFVVGLSMLGSEIVMGAEWATESMLRSNLSYNDNLAMRPSNTESATGYSIEPGIKFEGHEPNWKVGMETRIKLTRYNDIEDVDSDNYFSNLFGIRQTERHTFSLNGSFTRNNTFDTDYDTELPSAGLTDDHTERESSIIAPSWKWQATETSVLSVNLSTTNINYDEVTSSSYRDYGIDSASIRNIWTVNPRTQAGITLSYDEYENQKEQYQVLSNDFADYTKYKQYRYELFYSYAPGQTSNIELSVGRRDIDTVSYDQIVGCLLISPLGTCVVPDIEDVKISDKGTVVDVSYVSTTEVAAWRAGYKRSVIPSGSNGALERESVSLRYDRNTSERFKASLIMEAVETLSVTLQNTPDDRKRYRFEPLFVWKLTENWNFGVNYRYIIQESRFTNEESSSNSIYVNLYMNWPRLTSTY